MIPLLLNGGIAQVVVVEVLRVVVLLVVVGVVVVVLVVGVVAKNVPGVNESFYFSSAFVQFCLLTCSRTGCCGCGSRS